MRIYTHTHKKIVYTMSHSNQERQMNDSGFNLAQDGAIDDGKQFVGYLLSRFKEVMSNPTLHAELQAQIATNNMSSLFQKEGISERALDETSKIEIPMVERELGHSLPHEQRGNEDSQVRQENVQQNEALLEDRSDASSPSDDEEVAPRRHQLKKSPTPPKRRRSPSSHREEKARRQRKRKKRSPSFLFSSSSSSSDESNSHSSRSIVEL